MFGTLILIASTLYGCLFLVVTREITFQSVDTDNQKQVNAAATWRLWRWPSDMHHYGSGKTALKDTTVCFLSLFQMLCRDVKTDRPLVALCFVSNAISGLLIFLIGEQLFDDQSGIIMSLLFLSSIWPSHVALYGGHICVGQMIFLTAAWCCIQGEGGSS